MRLLGSASRWLRHSLTRKGQDVNSEAARVCLLWHFPIHIFSSLKMGIAFAELLAQADLQDSLQNIQQSSQQFERETLLTRLLAMPLFVAKSAYMWRDFAAIGLVDAIERVFK